MPVITQEDVVNAYNQYAGRNPTRAEIDQHTGQTVQNVAQAAHDYFVGPSQAAGEEGGFDFEALMEIFGGMGGGGEMSDTEKHHFELLDSQIEEQIRVQKEENDRVRRRRESMDKSIREQYGMSLEDFEAQQATGAAKISQAQQDRLGKALAGELPVDPALERQIVEDERTVRDKLLQQVGPGYETSTPGIQSLADFRQRAEELRSAARHDEIAAGISPTAASAQFGLSLIGAETSPDTTSIAQGLQGAIGSRQASIQANQGRANAMLAMAEMAQRERLAELEANLRRQQMAMAGGGSSQNKTVLSGSGAGKLAGSVGGALISSSIGHGGDPFYN